MADTHGFGCPWPQCRWRMVIQPGQTKDEVNQILFDHCNERHPGWTMLDMQRHAEERKRQLRTRSFLLN